MQEALKRVWPRFTYLGAITNEQARRHLAGLGPRPQRALLQYASSDASVTLLQTLDARLRLRDARKRMGLEVASWHGVTLGAAKSCVVAAGGGEIAAYDENEMQEGSFEGRTVNGWTI